MNDQVFIHEVTKRRLQNFITRPSHALILSAPAGTGKKTIALWLVGQITNQPLEKLAHQPQLRLLSPDGKSISIDEVRELSHFLKLRTTGQASLRRFIIVEQAEALTIEAQNAFLKLLEEPPADALIILTVNNPKALLPTVLSRAQTINIRQPAKAQLQQLFRSSDSDFEKLYSLSAGRPGLLMAMDQGEEAHPLLEAVEAAKSLLGSTKFEQLAKVDELARQKDDHLILEALQLIADRSINQAASRQDTANLRRWQKILQATFDAKNSLQKGAQAKLAFTNLTLSL